MKCIQSLCLLALLFCVQPLLAQQKLAKGLYTYFYRLDTHQARELILEEKPVKEAWFTQPVDSFPAGSTYTGRLPVGNYLQVSISGPDRIAVLYLVQPIDVVVLKNGKDLLFTVVDSLQQEIRPAKVSLGNRQVKFDSDVNAFRLPQSNRQGILSIEWEGYTSYLEISRRYNNPRIRRISRTVGSTFPLNHLLSPVRWVYRAGRNAWYGNWPPLPGFMYRIKNAFVFHEAQGYLQFNKPKYKPGDTVKLKAYLKHASGRPYRREMDVVLSAYSYRFSKTLATLKPDRKGAYIFNFVLHDSLKLRLDNTYEISLHNADDEEFIAEQFKLEYYKLASNTYGTRMVNDADNNGKTLYIKGTDVNNLPLYNTRYQVFLKTENISKFYTSLFVPDTLYEVSGILDPVGETRLDFPDSIFPGADLQVRAEVIFKTADNEVETRTVKFIRKAQVFPVKFDLKADSLVLQSTGADGPTEVTLQMGSVVEKVGLPYTCWMNPAVDQITLKILYKNKPWEKSFNPKSFSSQVEAQGVHSGDSLLVNILNPRKRNVRYFLYRNNRLIESGLTQGGVFHRKAHRHSGYRLVITGVWGGEAFQQSVNLIYSSKQLVINSIHPERVAPGQKVNMEVSILKPSGKAARGVDVTAYAMTSRFGSNLPELSITNKAPRFREINSFEERGIQRIDRGLLSNSWIDRFRLDSLFYYRILFPDSGRFEYRIPATQSQIEVAVVSKGKFQEIQTIALNGQLGLVNASNFFSRSIPCSPDFYRIEVRLGSSYLTISQVQVKPNEKLLLVVDKDHLPPGITSVSVPYGFTSSEVDKINNTLIWVENVPVQAKGYLKQGNRIFPVMTNEGYPQSLASFGPFQPGTLEYVNQIGQRRKLQFKPGYRYRFLPDGITELEKMTEVPKPRFSYFSTEPEIYRVAPEEATMWEYWKRMEKVLRKFSRFPEITQEQTSRIQLKISSQLTSDSLHGFFLNHLTDHRKSILSPVAESITCYPGKYVVYGIFHGGAYFKTDTLETLPNGVLGLVGDPHVLPPDTVTRFIKTIIEDWTKSDNYWVPKREDALTKLSLLTYRTFPETDYGHVITGIVRDATDGTPVPGVNVIVKGTMIGTVTDIHGRYILNCPPDAILVFSFIGLATVELPQPPGGELDVSMIPDVTQLGEVVVVGYGVTHKRELTGSVSTVLSGRVAGVTLQGSENVRVRIRGASTIKSKQPLFVLDGVVVDPAMIDPDQVQLMVVLDSAQSAIYGSRSSGGVILATTKTQLTSEELIKQFQEAQEPEPIIQSLRRHFRDDAFWVPDLVTDRQGKARFTVTFPDDITAWNYNLIAMKGKFAGLQQQVIRSYRPILAQLSLPDFLMVGDSARAYAKLSNYTPSPVAGRVSVTIGDRESAHAFNLSTSQLDTLELTASSLDSLSVRYALTTSDYQDGEMRKVAILQPGVEVDSGYYRLFTHDTTLMIDASTWSEARIDIQASPLRMLEDELNYLDYYRYGCNEQLASKLRALLIRKELTRMRQESFNGDARIRSIIKKLVANQSRSGSWSWWEDHGGSQWVTLHVAEALLRATKAGYQVNWNREKLDMYLQQQLEGTWADLDIYLFFARNGIRVNLPDLFKETPRSKVSLTEHLKRIELLALSGVEVTRAQVIEESRKTAMGGVYWADKSGDIFLDNTLATLAAYRILASLDSSAVELSKIRNYFFEIRKKSWRNTAESILILETLMKSIFKEKAIDSKLTLQSDGKSYVLDRNQTHLELPSPGKLELRYQGSTPMALSVTQTQWNSLPIRTGTDLRVQSSWVDSVLIAGKPATLQVEVEVKSRTTYVMLEVPIPAGCQFAGKPMANRWDEYREYYPDRVNYYFTVLVPGKHTFRIELLPRFTGKFTLNPARIQQMYLPVKMGFESLKRVEIR